MGKYSPVVWHEYIYDLLEGAAARRADQNPRVKDLVMAEHVAHVQDNDVRAVKNLPLKLFTPVNNDASSEFKLLKQEDNENPWEYCPRLEDFLHAARSLIRNTERSVLAERQSLVDLAIRHYLVGFRNTQLRYIVGGIWQADTPGVCCKPLCMA